MLKQSPCPPVFYRRKVFFLSVLGPAFAWCSLGPFACREASLSVNLFVGLCRSSSSSVDSEDFPPFWHLVLSPTHVNFFPMMAAFLFLTPQVILYFE